MTTSQLDYLLPKGQTIMDADRDTENRETLHIIVENMDQCGNYETIAEVPLKTKNRTTT